MIDTITKFLGIATQYNPLTTAPGTASKADNCVNLRENVVEDRRGYTADDEMASNVKQLLAYNGKVIAHNGTTLSYGPGTYADYSGSYSEPTSNRIRSTAAASNLYFTTNEGVKVITDTVGTAARRAGVPRSLDPSFALASGSSGFLADTYQCAYRCLISRTDANGNVLTGYPSTRLWVTNSAGNGKNVDLTLYLPSECIAGDVVEFYRTAQYSGTSDDTSGEEMGLVYRYSLSSTDISTGYITFTDSITDALRGANLYTNPSEQGILQANDRPPLCKDIALYRSSYMMFANTQTKQRLFLTLVGTSGLSGKYITIAGVNYEFNSSEIISGAGSPQVLVSATGVAAVDIDLTARSLVRVINRYAGNTGVYAYYLTGPDDLPGQILIEERGIGAAAFTTLAEDTGISAMFFPAPPVGTPNTASTSTNSVQKNAIYYSKANEYEAVPTLNYILVGAANEEILRIVPLRESLIVITEKGVYRWTGESPQNFTVVPMDTTVFCKSLDSVAVLSNQVLFLSNQGVVSVSETGVSVISRDIEPSLKPLLLVENLANYTFGFGYESDRHYFLSTITDVSDTEQNQTFVYNTFTRTWVRWTFGIKAAVVEPNSDKLYFAKPDSAIVYVERKTFTNEDYADPEISITIDSISGYDVTFTLLGSVAPVEGWAIKQAGTAIPIESFTILGGGQYLAQMQTEPPAGWAAGAAELFPSVGMDLEYNPWSAAQPGLMKQVRAVKVLTDNTLQNSLSTIIYATFKSNFDEAQEEQLLSSPGAGWGTGAWGNFGWGGGGDSYGYPTWVPKNKQYCTRLSVGVRHKSALEKTSICGIALDFETISDRIGR